MTEQPSERDGFGTDGHLTDEQLASLADPRLHHPEPDTELSPESTDQQTNPKRPGSTEAQREHLALCPPCRAAFEATERALLALRDPAALHQPPAELWDRIAAEIAATPESAQRTPAAGPRGSVGDASAASVTELRPRSGEHATQTGRTGRRRGLWIPLAAAAAGAVLGGAAVAAVLGQDDAAEVDPPVAVPTVVGDAALEPVAAEDFTGRAEMVETEAGDLELTVEISAAPDPEAGYFEVWLRDEDGTQLISLGSATAGSTTFTVPAGIDLSQYPVVDVSHEHFDGDPTHSGTTLGAGPMEVADS